MEFKVLRPTPEQLENRGLEDQLETLIESHLEDQKRMYAEREITIKKDAEVPHKGYEVIQEEEMNAIWQNVLDKSH